MEATEHELNKSIISEMIAATKDESFPKEFREAIKNELYEIREDVDKMILMES